MPKNKREIIYYLANKYRLPIQKVEEIVNYQFKYTSKIIKEGNFESIRLPYFGKWSVNPNRVKYLTKLTESKKDNESE
tara:strand:- start:513 stop:746 length:234 start_codon:yes stop_codon:yes gene_type:complete